MQTSPIPDKTREYPRFEQWTYTEYKQSWEKAREKMALSPSLVHFGHFIAGVANDLVGS